MKGTKEIALRIQVKNPRHPELSVKRRKEYPVIEIDAAVC